MYLEVVNFICLSVDRQSLRDRFADETAQNIGLLS